METKKIQLSLFCFQEYTKTFKVRKERKVIILQSLNDRSLKEHLRWCSHFSSHLQSVEEDAMDDEI